MHISVIRSYNDKPVSFNRHFVTMGCGITGALMISQAIYWSDKGEDDDGWIYKTQAEWEKETGLTRREQESARKRLGELGLLHEKRVGVPARLYYKVDLVRAHELLLSVLGISAGSTSPKPAIQNGAFRQSSLDDSANLLYTENTTEKYIGQKQSVNRDQMIEILTHLNQMAGTSYRPVDSNLRLIEARLKEGATIADMKRVIDAKCVEWKDGDMRKYLRPETLFRASKFGQYLGALGKASVDSQDTFQSSARDWI